MKSALIMFVFLGSTTRTSTATPCSAGWFDGNPYNLGCVQFNGTTALTWDNAQEFCHTQEESNLVEIFNQDQQDFLKLMAEQLEIFTGDKRHWWIGATDVAYEGRWIWPHKLETVDYAAWYGAEPNSGPTNNYAIMNYGADFMWTDQTEVSTYYPICQKL
eukprot:TRINITY_DN35102_c0_g1_i1.p1 TRINITY_DN35102_c0_g1~~TRINITY_DN35102_c0_g1_i1.p1  ORF type:complete len:160 (+),score=38.34 TRINITY_DN35102_c0_g1_i1:1-480(+)